VRQALTSTAQDLGDPGRDPFYGFGLVQAESALSALAGLTAPPPPPPPLAIALTITNGPTAVVTNLKQGLFEIRWTTNNPSTTDVNIGGTWYTNSTLTTDHRRSFRGSKGVTYTYTVRSADAANSTVTATATFTLQ
jgi:hypothetical protein